MAETNSPPPPRPIEVFRPEVIERLGRRDEPVTAAKAELGGPWHVREIEGGFGLYRTGDAEYGLEPEVRVDDYPLALLTAAVLEVIGRTPRFEGKSPRGAVGCPILFDGTEIGSARSMPHELVAVLNVLHSLVSIPSALAMVLEAAGPTALARVGRELGLRLSRSESGDQLREAPVAADPTADPPAPT